MGLKESIQSLMPRVITALGTLAFTGTYHSTGTLTYSPTTGNSIETLHSDTTVTGVMVAYTEEELAKNTKYEIFNTDKKILIPSITLLNIVPKMTDYITISSVIYQVINKSIDPAEAMWEIQVRI